MLKNCYQKKYQYYLFVFLFFEFIVRMFQIEKNIKPILDNFFDLSLIFFGGIFFIFVWNDWMYTELTISQKKPISKKTFQCIATLFILVCTLAITIIVIYYFM